MISLQNVSFGYDNLPLFIDLSVEFKAGGIYGILGKNGAGKTSLLKLISGLLRSRSGDCEVLGHSAESRNVEILQDLFFISESYYLPPITIRKYRELHAPLYRHFDLELFNQNLTELSLDEKQPLNTLSYGLSKRFLLAFGLATNCKILLLDEPTNGLDIPTKRIFRKLMAGSISKERVFLIATHQIKEVETVFDQLVFIDQGKILLSCSTDLIARRLRFKPFTTDIESENLVFKEEIPGGYSTIELNRDDEEGKTDFEFLFNAVMEDPERLSIVLTESEELAHV